jgi:hypothetical protein
LTPPLKSIKIFNQTIVGLMQTEMEETVTRERKCEIAMKFWQTKFRQAEFKREKSKIERNAARIAGQIGHDCSLFLRFIGFASGKEKMHRGWDRLLGEVALRFTEHRIMRAKKIVLGNALRRRVEGVAKAIGEPIQDCLEFVREILAKKLIEALS